MPKEKAKAETDNVLESLKSGLHSLQSEMNTFLTKNCKLKMDSKSELSEVNNPPLNLILGGGIPIGNLVMLVGRSGGGKSSLAAQLLSNNQKLYGENHTSLYFDSEQTMTPLRLYQLGVRNPPIAPIQDFTLEELFKTIYNIALFKKEKKLDFYTTIIWDSLNNTMTEKEIDSTNPKEVIGYKQRFLSLYLPKVINVCKQNRITLIMINQLRDKVSLGVIPTANQLKYLKGDKTIPGGNSVIFNSAQIISIQESATLKPEEWGEELFGHEVDVFCIKNKFFASNVPVKMIFDFKSGIQMDWSMYLFLREHKKITPGAYHKLQYYVTETGELKTWRKLEFPNLWNNDPKFRECCLKCFEEIKQMYADKYVGNIQIDFSETDVSKTSDMKFEGDMIQMQTITEEEEVKSDEIPNFELPETELIEVTDEE